MIWLNNNIIQLGQKFPDGTFAFHIQEHFLGDGRRAIIRWHYENESEMTALFYITRHLKQVPCDKVELILPYCPNARMDRVHHDDEIFTLKYFAEFINMLNFDSVSILDPHSNVATALINNCAILSPEPFIRRAMTIIGDPDLLLFYPDEGAMKRYSDMIKNPYGFGIKRRCWETGKITGLDVVCNVDVKGKNILIVDDICCRGGTFLHSAKALKGLGAKDISVFCSHCENAVFDGELLTTDFVKRIFTTNSLIRKKSDRITEFNLMEGI